jgi:hypothetical protein
MLKLHNCLLILKAIQQTVDINVRVAQLTVNTVGSIANKKVDINAAQLIVNITGCTEQLTADVN